MPASSQLNLLLIEDSDDDAELVVLELQRSGFDFRVTRTCTAAGVRAALDQHTFSLVISDYRMPGFLGADALALGRERDADVPFIVVSGTIGEEIAVDLIRAGADDYVMKWNLSRLALAIVRELGRVKAQQEHRRVREELERSRGRLAYTVEIAPVGVCHNDTSGRWTMVNQSFCDMLGYSAEELLARRWNDVTHPDDLAEGERARTAMARGDFPTVMVEKRYVRKDGSIVWVLLSASAVRGADHQIEYYVAVISDITERRMAQEEVRRRASQQEAIAIFGHMALAGCSLELLRDELTARLASVMDVDLCDVYEVEPGGALLRLVAGSGWPEGTVGAVTLPAGHRSHAGHTLETGLATTFHSLADERRFAVPPLLLEQGIVSGLIIPIAGGEDGQFATIGIYSRQTRHFDMEDESFLRACANIVAEAFQRQKNEAALRRHARQQTALAQLASRLLREPADRIPGRPSSPTARPGSAAAAPASHWPAPRPRTRSPRENPSWSPTTAPNSASTLTRTLRSTASAPESAFRYVGGGGCSV
jgi:PAS domain S-box-containing protein